ncbi:MAG: hypothetical protein K8R07_02030 [Desulfobacterales bacterium]|nr:hypothetical protein [Desulfobacterales bacterium]
MNEKLKLNVKKKDFNKVAGDICGFHRNTVFRLIRTKRILGVEAVIEDNRGLKSPYKYIGKVRIHIKKLLRKYPDWTDQAIAEEAAKELQVEISRSATARIRTEKQDKQRHKQPLCKAELIAMATVADIDLPRFFLSGTLLIRRFSLSMVISCLIMALTSLPKVILRSDVWPCKAMSFTL